VAVALEAAATTTRLGILLYHSHGQTALRQMRGCRYPADSSADDDCGA
jgi:hypothetical protein